MSRARIVLEGVGGLSYALLQFGVAVAVSTVEVVAGTVRDIRRAVELERRTEEVGRVLQAMKLAREYEAAQRERRQCEALDRVVKAYNERERRVDAAILAGLPPIGGDVFSRGVLDPPVPPIVHRRLDCRPWCGHNYQEEGVPCLFSAPAVARKPYSSYWAWCSSAGAGDLIGGRHTIVWCTPECREAKRPPNPTAPGSAAKS
jgi:hypothetical protein